jgi:hypothetical protein
VPVVVPELLPDPDPEELPLDDEPVLAVVDELDDPSLPPQAATSAAVPPATSQLNTRRRC